MLSCQFKTRIHFFFSIFPLLEEIIKMYIMTKAKALNDNKLLQSMKNNPD